MSKSVHNEIQAYTANTYTYKLRNQQVEVQNNYIASYIWQKVMVFTEAEVMRGMTYHKHDV